MLSRPLNAYVFPEPAVAQRDPYRRAVEGLMTRMEAGFGQQGYSM